MTLNGGIQRFLNDVDSKIFRRGLDYYHSGMVEHLGRDGSRITAEVAGSGAEPYRVEISLTEDGEVADWSCDCPYDWGPVCKHTVAALLALQSEPAEDMGKHMATLRELTAQAGKERLTALVLEHCRQDRRFLYQALSELEETGACELELIRELVGNAVQAVTRGSHINERGCVKACAQLDAALERARRRTERGQYGQALEIARFVLLTGAKLFAVADSGFPALGFTLDAALRTVEPAAAGLAESGADREPWLQCLLETAQEPVFDGCPRWRYGLLCRAAVLADADNEWAFYAALATLGDRRSAQGEPRYDGRDQAARYCVIRHAHGAQQARAYLEQSPSADTIRLMLAQEFMKEEN